MPCRLERRVEDGWLHLWLSGEIDEDFCVSALHPGTADGLVLHLEAVRAVNSCGVREWISLMTQQPPGVALRFAECSVPVTRQFAMLSNFRGPGQVESFYAPYYCEPCDSQVDKLLVVERDFPDGRIAGCPEFDCDSCGEPLEFDSLERVYFSFLETQMVA